MLDVAMQHVTDDVGDAVRHQPRDARLVHRVRLRAQVAQQPVGVAVEAGVVGVRLHCRHRVKDAAAHHVLQ